MKLIAFDYNILSYLIQANKLSYSDVIDWAYKQYSDDGVDPFVEKIAIACDSKEIVEMISNQFQVYGVPGMDFLVGEVVGSYNKGSISLHSAIDAILYRIDVELSDEEAQELHIADDYFGWHKSPEAEALKHVGPMFNRYMSVYEEEVGKFCV